MSPLLAPKLRAKSGFWHPITLPANVENPHQHQSIFTQNQTLVVNSGNGSLRKNSLSYDFHFSCFQFFRNVIPAFLFAVRCQIIGYRTQTNNPKIVIFRFGL